MHMIRNFLGKGGATKSDEFSEKIPTGAKALRLHDFRHHIHLVNWPVANYIHI